MSKIKRAIIPLISIMILLLSACQSSPLIDVITFQPKEYDVMFLTDKTNSALENIYYDAIIEVKAEYPHAFSEVQTNETTIEDIENVTEQETPALLITKDGRTIESLSGEMEKDEIKEKLEGIIK
ncbi:hypothetical protein [Virgibacillus salexigens]|uniref:hypothetical protein n=1 Tax=Virgibacillus TaxID=84406 RepID=UPI00136CF15A|nr:MULTISPECIES: hypothetical protein [Virgibacillus]MYL42393.1 hypothetical protein [Virgibacillus massiliensis]